MNLSAESYADADIGAAITAASRMIDKTCGRRFWKDSADTTRYFERIDKELVLIDDLATLTSLKTDPDGDGSFAQIWTIAIDFVLEPANAVVNNEPFTLIHSRYHYTGRYYLPAGP